MDNMKKEDMEKVQGGKIYDWTTMKCSACGFTQNWAGNYESRNYTCPMCKAEHKFTGVEYFPGTVTPIGPFVG